MLTKSKIKQFFRLIHENKFDEFDTFLSENGPEILSKIHPTSTQFPVHAAAEAGSTAILSVLKSHNVNFNVTDSDGKHPLHYAASSGQIDAVNFLLITCPDHINALKRADWTPLMMAVAKPQSIEICKILLDNGANVELVNKDGWTPLHIAARTGDDDTFFSLLSTAPELLQKFSKNGRSILNTICLHGHYKIFSKLFTLHPKLCLHLARDRLIVHDIARSKSPKILNILTKLSEYFQPGDWLVSDRAGFTPLHAAAQAGRVDNFKNILKIVGEKYLDVATQGGSNMSSLHLAYKENQTEMINYLVARGANEQNRDKFNRLPIDCKKLV